MASSRLSDLTARPGTVPETAEHLEVQKRDSSSVHCS